MTCKHEHGDHIKAIGMWVCGQCYEKLGEQPKRYGMGEGMPMPSFDGKYGRQEIVWRAEVLKSQNGTTLNTFLKSVVRRFMHRDKGLGVYEAYGLAIEAMKAQDAEFGHVDYCWDRAGAIDIADEEMHYWDEDVPAGN